jgi:hypothetical protein
MCRVLQSDWYLEIPKRGQAGCARFPRPSLPLSLPQVRRRCWERDYPARDKVINHVIVVVIVSTKIAISRDLHVGT